MEKIISFLQERAEEYMKNCRSEVERMLVFDYENPPHLVDYIKTAALQSERQSARQLLLKLRPRYLAMKEEMIPAIGFWSFLANDKENFPKEFIEEISKIPRDQRDAYDQKFKREFLKKYVDHGNKYVSLVAMVESLPVRVWRRILWNHNIDFNTPESFFRRLETVQYNAIRENYNALFAGKPELPPIFKTQRRLKDFVDSFKGRMTPQALLDEIGDEELRTSSKGAWSYNLFGLDMGFNAYPKGLKNDTKVINKSIFKFISPKHPEEEFVVNQEFGRYFFAYGKSRSNNLWRKDKKVELKSHICPGFWITMAILALFFVISPVLFFTATLPFIGYAMGSAEPIGGGFLQVFWTIFAFVGLVTPMYFVMSFLRFFFGKILGPFFRLPAVSNSLENACEFIEEFMRNHWSQIGHSFCSVVGSVVFCGVFIAMGGYWLFVVVCAFLILYTSLYWSITKKWDENTISLPPGRKVVKWGFIVSGGLTILTVLVENYAAILAFNAEHWTIFALVGYCAVLIGIVFLFFNKYEKVSESFQIERGRENWIVEDRQKYEKSENNFRNITLVGILITIFLTVVMLHNLLIMGAWIEAIIVLIIIAIPILLCIWPNLEIWMPSFDKYVAKRRLAQNLLHNFYSWKSETAESALAKNKWLNSLSHQEMLGKIEELRKFLDKLHCYCGKHDSEKGWRSCCCEDDYSSRQRKRLLVHILNNLDAQVFDLLIGKTFEKNARELGLNPHYVFYNRHHFAELIVTYRSMKSVKKIMQEYVRKGNKINAVADLIFGKIFGTILNGIRAGAYGIFIGFKWATCWIWWPAIKIAVCVKTVLVTAAVLANRCPIVDKPKPMFAKKASQHYYYD